MTPKIVLDLPEESPVYAVEPTLVDRAPRGFPEQELETRKVDMDRLCVEYEDVDADDEGLDPSMFDRPPWGDGAVVKEVTILADTPPQPAISAELAEKLRQLANVPPHKTQLGWTPAKAKGTMPPPVRSEPEAILDVVEDDFDAAFDAAFDMTGEDRAESEPEPEMSAAAMPEGEVVAEMAMPIGSAPVELPAELPPPPVMVSGPVVIHPTNGSAPAMAMPVAPLAPAVDLAVAEDLPPPIALPEPAMVAPELEAAPAELPPAISLPEPAAAEPVAESMELEMPAVEPEPMKLEQPAVEPEPMNMEQPAAEPEPMNMEQPAAEPEPMNMEQPAAEPMMAAEPITEPAAPPSVVSFSARVARVMPLPPPPDFDAPIELPAEGSEPIALIAEAEIAESPALETAIETAVELAPVIEPEPEPVDAQPEPVAAMPESEPAMMTEAATDAAVESTAAAPEPAATEATPAPAKQARSRSRQPQRRRNRGFPKDNPFKPKPEAPIEAAPAAIAPPPAAELPATPVAELPTAPVAEIAATPAAAEPEVAEPIVAEAVVALEAPAPVALVPIKEAAAQRRGQVIVFFGCRGGAGTTTLATNFAGELAKAGEETLLLDMDLELGDSLTNLSLEAGKGSFSGLAREFETLNDTALKARLAQHRSGLYVLAQSGRREELDREFVHRMPALLEHLRRRFDTIIIDGIREFSEVALAAISAADTIALVITQEVGAIRRARRVLDLFDKLGVPMEKRTLIVNRFHRFTKYNDREIERALGLHVAAKIRTATGATQKAQSRGTLVCEVAKLNGIVRDLRKMTHLVTINPVI